MTFYGPDNFLKGAIKHLSFQQSGKPQPHAFWLSKFHLTVAANSGQLSAGWAQGSGVVSAAPCNLYTHLKNMQRQKVDSKKTAFTLFACGWVYIFCSRWSGVTSEQDRVREPWVNAWAGITWLMYFGDILMPSIDWHPASLPTP